jgi:hypothetical protein
MIIYRQCFEPACISCVDFRVVNSFWEKKQITAVLWFRTILIGSISDPNPGSGAILSRGSEIRNRSFFGSRIPDLGTRITNDKFLGEKY